MFFTSIKGSWHVEDEGRDGYDDDNESAITKGMFAYYLDSSGHENDEKKTKNLLIMNTRKRQQDGFTGD